MSDNAAIISSYIAIRYNYSCSIAAAALLIYDYFITLEPEVGLFWTGASVTAAPILFYATRYLGLLSLLLGRVKAAPHISLESCQALVKAGSIVDYLPDIPVGAFSGLRVFALSKGNWTISLIVFMLSIVPLGTNLSLFNMGLTGTINPIHGCAARTETLTLEKTIICELKSLPPKSFSDVESSAVSVVTNAALILANAIIITVTWKTLEIRSLRKQFSREFRRGFASILLWNGTIYFVAILSLTVLNVIFSVTSIFGAGGSALGVLIQPLMSILVWRFMIDLQGANQSALKLDSDDALYFTDGGRSLSFARAIGSIGAIVSEEQDISREPEDTVEVDAVVERCRSRTGCEDVNAIGRCRQDGRRDVCMNPRA
ncbi:hypothetical protein C8T65DRAFT_833272 [Cerioporus squamosus]|nr:hypothetical protein C8T65DRAFT_833272 [Cerioporus squamosus]